jgi:phytoene dehydrogenase-like protein
MDVVVIGSGHNGLVCAGYLAKAGLDVIVVERNDHIGGGCITQELVPGCRFSTFAYGAHGPGPKICRDLEIPTNAFSIAELDPGMFAPYPDGDYVMLWSDVEKTAAGLARLLQGGSRVRRQPNRRGGLAQVRADQRGTLWKTYSRLERFLQQRVRGWLVHKHRIGSRGECRYPAGYIYDTLGVVCPTGVLGNSRKP